MTSRCNWASKRAGAMCSRVSLRCSGPWHHGTMRTAGPRAARAPARLLDGFSIAGLRHVGDFVALVLPLAMILVTITVCSVLALGARRRLITIALVGILTLSLSDTAVSSHEPLGEELGWHRLGPAETSKLGTRISGPASLVGTDLGHMAHPRLLFRARRRAGTRSPQRRNGPRPSPSARSSCGRWAMDSVYVASLIETGESLIVVDPLHTWMRLWALLVPSDHWLDRHG